MDQTIGAYYQCHKNPASFIRTVKSFQKFYPERTIVVTNDGGHDYEEFCKDNNIIYKYKPKNSLNTKIDSTRRSCFQSHPDMYDYIKNLWTGFDSIKENYVLILEDDVRVLKKHTETFKYSINGCNYGVKFPPRAIRILHEIGYNGPLHYGACGGCVLDKNFFKNIPFYKVEELISKIGTYEEMYDGDLVISFIAVYFGGNIGQYGEFAETWFKNIEELHKMNGIAFLHQYKNDYQSLPTEDEARELKNYLL
jgi:hypothetical protein